MNKPIIWFTGMSGSGKSTLSNHIKDALEKIGKKVLIIDGDVIRDFDQKKLGFAIDDVLINNTRIASIAKNERKHYDLVLIPVISPYEKIRQKIRKILEPNFYLVYLKTDIDVLIKRDPKGLYKAADNGEIKDLIGYSDVNPYEEPVNPELIVLMSNNQSVDDSANTVISFIKNIHL